MPFYIISLKHTKKSDEYITMWRPENAGYTQDIGQAGIYESIDQGYHESEESIPIAEETILSCAAIVNYHGEEKKVLINHKQTFRKLGIKI